MAVTRTEGTDTGLRWGGIAGIVFAVLFVVGFLFFPMALFVLWMLAVGIVMLRSSGAAATADHAAPADA